MLSQRGDPPPWTYPLNLKATGKQRDYFKGLHLGGTRGQSQVPARTPARKKRLQGAGSAGKGKGPPTVGPSVLGR